MESTASQELVLESVKRVRQEMTCRKTQAVEVALTWSWRPSEDLILVAMPKAWDATQVAPTREEPLGHSEESRFSLADDDGIDLGDVCQGVGRSAGSVGASQNHEGLRGEALRLGGVVEGLEARRRRAADAEDCWARCSEDFGEAPWVHLPVEDLDAHTCGLE
jgi:hypothetical protein